MRFISLYHLPEYNDTARYAYIEEGIYQDDEALKDIMMVNDKPMTSREALEELGLPLDNYCLALRYKLEEGEGKDDQYPIEDILDRYRVYVSTMPRYLEDDTVAIAFGGTLDRMRGLKELIGRRAYNREVEEDGEDYIELVIE